MHLLDFVFFPGCVIPTDNSKFNPNRLFPWMTWERFAKGRTLVGVDEDDEDFATAGLELGEKKHQLTKDEMAEHQHQTVAQGYSLSLRSSLGSAGQQMAVFYGSGGNYTGLIGGNKPHNNIQPSTTVYYWRRVS